MDRRLGDLTHRGSRPDPAKRLSLEKPASPQEMANRLNERAAEMARRRQPDSLKSLFVRSIERNGHLGDDRHGPHAPPKAGHPTVAKSDHGRHPSPHSGLSHSGHRYQSFHDRVRGGHLDSILRNNVARRIDLTRQYSHHHSGDVARRLHLHSHLYDHGGWRDRHHCGRLSSGYLSVHFGHHYCGPRSYPSRVWWPHWSDWVRWSWWDNCHLGYDPRPVFCRPIVYHSCPRVVVYNYPRWEPLHTVGGGTWVDVPEVVVQPQRYDVQLLAVRFVDAGHPEQKLGPRFRVWVRNNSNADMAAPFNVSVIASNDDRVNEKLPQAGVRVEAIKAGETQSVDVRLPWEVYEMGRDAEGRPAPFAQLHVIVDSHGEISETSETNNGNALKREEILPVDPAAFSTDVDTVAAGDMVSIAGEGLGPEPGEVLLYVKGLELQPEIQGWYDLGVRVKIPELPLAEATEAELVVVRGDTAASNPVKLMLAPKGTKLLPAP